MLRLLRTVVQVCEYSIACAFAHLDSEGFADQLPDTIPGPQTVCVAMSLRSFFQQFAQRTIVAFRESLASRRSVSGLKACRTVLTVIFQPLAHCSIADTHGLSNISLQPTFFNQLDCSFAARCVLFRRVIDPPALY